MSEAGRDRAPARTRLLWLLLAAAGALSLAGAVLDPRRAAFSYLAAWAAVLGIALGALSLLMIARVTGARWLDPLLPVARATAGTLPLLAVLFLPVAAGMHLLYPWVPPLPVMPAAVREHMLAKAAYLNPPFFLLRAVVYFAIWILLTELLLRGEPTTRRRWAAIGLPPFAFALTFASIDWLMSLLPAWWSTIFGLYFWSGGFLAALAWIALGSSRRAIPVAANTRSVDDTPDAGEAAAAARSNTLGKLILTFVLFWGYVGFSQFLVIWIGDVPLEASWLAPRLAGSWAVVGVVLLLGQFALPFALLLPRRNRERAHVLALIAAGLLVMHFIDVYWLVLPALTPAAIEPHWLDLTNLLAVAGVTVAFGGWRLRRLAPDTAAALAREAWW